MFPFFFLETHVTFLKGWVAALPPFLYIYISPPVAPLSFLLLGQGIPHRRPPPFQLLSPRSQIVFFQLPIGRRELETDSCISQRSLSGEGEMGQRSVPAPFLMKTYKLVDDQSTDEVIGWSEGGTTFVVWKTADFAKDLLPKYFKHNNFSSFVRQLNTYGFRKIAPDKWEFANENFKRGQRELLVQICRRKTTTSTPSAEKSAPGPLSPLNSGDDLGSTSTSSPDSKNAGSVDAPTERAQFSDLSDKNKKLKRDNEMLTSELARAKKHCGELIAFLTEYVKVAPDQMDHIMRQGSSWPTLGGLDGEIGDDPNNHEIMKDENDEGLKLFGVWVKGDGKKRGREDNLGFGGSHRKEMKRVEVSAPWMTGKVCN